MTHSEIRDKMREIIASVLDTPADDVPDTPGLPYQLFFDSLSVLEILVSMESEFQTTLDVGEENVLEILDSLDSAANYVEQRLTPTAG